MTITSRRLRLAIAVVAVLVPGRVRRFLMTRLLGHQIHPTARIGRSLIDVDHFRAGPGSMVTALSVIRGCESVQLDEDACIGSLVWVNAVRKDKSAIRSDIPRDTSLVLRRGAALTTLHFVDCCDRVELGEFSVLGGLMSQVLTHSFEYRHSTHLCEPVSIGAYSIIGTRSTLLPGTVIGSRSIVAAGSVLTGGSYPELTLLAGVPAVPKRGLDPDAKAFARTGFIH